PDIRPRRPAAVRQAGLCLRAGPRRRREDPALEGEIRPDSREHERPDASASEEGVEAEEAEPPGDGNVLERGSVHAAEGSAARPALQQGAVAMAVAGVPAYGVAGGGADSPRGAQAPDGREPHQGRGKGAGADAADTAPSGPCGAGSAAPPRSSGERGRG